MGYSGANEASSRTVGGGEKLHPTMVEISDKPYQTTYHGVGTEDVTD
jgi:hypothetical protein